AHSVPVGDTTLKKKLVIYGKQAGLMDKSSPAIRLVNAVEAVPTEAKSSSDDKLSTIAISLNLTLMTLVGENEFHQPGVWVILSCNDLK
ncbi:MAG: hypothetical protein AAF623_21370, partial [Planctomycetota bacterium]